MMIHVRIEWVIDVADWQIYGAWKCVFSDTADGEWDGWPLHHMCLISGSN